MILRRILPLLLFLSLVPSSGAVDVSILDFQIKPNALKRVSREEAEYLTGRVRKVAAEQDEAWRILSRENIQKILEENGKDYAECMAGAEGKCEVAVGQILQADYHVVGDLSAVGSKLALSLRVYDVKSGQMRASDDVMGSDIDGLVASSDSLARALFGKIARSRVAKLDPAPAPVVPATTLAPLVPVSGTAGAKAPDRPGMVRIPAGCFQMGARRCGMLGGEGALADECPQHTVCLDSFRMDVTEVTQGAYRDAWGSNPSRFSSCGDNCPVEGVDWNQANSYCERVGKRLPTEAEWEYVARAGTTTKWSWGDDASRAGEYAWHDGNSGDQTHPVGLKRANPWGLYDMAGNVGEWTADWYERYSSGEQRNPTGPAGPALLGSARVIRGGGWNVGPTDLRSSVRLAAKTGYRKGFLGFRCVLSGP